MFRVAILFLAFSCALYAQTQTRGDAAIAERYVEWAQNAINNERWAEALAALERGTDFADVSSDISYLLAKVRSHQNKPRGEVIQALYVALATNRWNTYSEIDAQFLMAETLIQLRRYNEALSILAPLPHTVDTFSLRLLALKGLNNREYFTEVLSQAMDRHPREARPVRIFFEYMQDKNPTGRESELMTLSLRRLPVLLQSDRELAYLASPFIFNTDEARRILSAYRARGLLNPSYIPYAINLGIIDGNTAVEELFSLSNSKIDKNLLLSIWQLLRDNSERNRFREKILNFSGIITEDFYGSGYPQIQVFYKDGIITQYIYDGNQDKKPEITIFFENGIPDRMETPQAVLQWEQYPSVLETRYGENVYKPKPFDFSFFPIYFARLESGGLLYPERNINTPALSLYLLINSSIHIERKSREFIGGIERIELQDGILVKAREFLNGRLVSETEFQSGLPVLQRIDLDNDGYLETVRRFRQPDTGFSMDFDRIIASSESDLHRNGFFGYRELYIHDDENGTVRTIRLWDLNKDGIVEISDETKHIRK